MSAVERAKNPVGYYLPRFEGVALGAYPVCLIKNTVRQTGPTVFIAYLLDGSQGLIVHMRTVVTGGLEQSATEAAFNVHGPLAA